MIDLGQNGIFISDEGRYKLNIALSDKEFEKLKDEVKSGKEDPNEKKKCFITGKYFKIKDGLMLSKEWVAKSLQKSLDSQERVYRLYKDQGIVICSNCGTNHVSPPKEFNCPKCNTLINSKKYGKSVKLPMTKKIAFNLYIKMLKK